MDFAALLLQQSIVNDLLGERVLEYILQIRLNRLGSDKVKPLKDLSI